LELCEACGRAFGTDDGTPLLIAEDAVAEVSFRFPQRNSAKSDACRAQYIRYPRFADAGGDAPYHLDRAHAALLYRLPAGMRVLEIGCGGGQMRRWFEARGMQYVGVDLSKTRVFDWLRAHGGPDVLCDAHFLPFQDAQFDVVYAAAVTEHVACPIRYAQEAHRVLRPRGHFLANTAFLEPWHDASHFHLSPDGVVELLLEAGFAIDAVWPGRDYHCFRALPDMAFHGPLRLLRHLAWLPMLAYRLQGRARNLRRRLRGLPPVREVMHDGVVAGAVDWIAHRAS
jgi:SAM-dependent methyltransferase